VKSFKALLFVLIAVGMTWIVVTPAQAQLLGGCYCPTGFLPRSGTSCAVSPVSPAVPAICPFRNVGHIAAAQQQQSFWGINQILQQRRDQLQHAPGGGATGSKVSYAPDNSEAGALAYSDRSQKNNPLASPLYDEAPAPTPPAPVWGAWVQGLADTEKDSPLSASDIGHIANTYTAQAGLDRTQQGILSSDDAFVVGVVSSWTSGHTGFAGSPTTMNLTGPGVGVYTEYVKGGFSTDVTAKFDFLQMFQDLAGAAPNTSIDILNSGLSGNAQYKITGFLGSDSNFVEPTVGFSLSHTSFGSGAAVLGLEDAYTVRLQAGARVGTTWDAGKGVSIDANLKALIYGDAIAQGTSVATATVGTFSPPAISPSDSGMIRGELDPELCFNLPNDYSVTLSGQLRGGRAILGESAGLNLRKQF